MHTITYVNALKDNYIWIMLSEDKRHAVVVDPGEAEPVLRFLDQHNIELSAILLTHHHKDHSAGIPALAEIYHPKIYAYSQQSCTAITDVVQEENPIFLHTLNVKFAILKTPGHTNDAICFFDGSNLFCGDTLFAGGCGRLFEGTAEQMFNSLNQLAALPEQTRVYCGHEYTLANLHFALELDPENTAIKQRLQEVKALRNRQTSSLPSNIAIEKTTNPFLRCKDKEFAKRIAKQFHCDPNDPLQVFTAIRHFKDNWSSHEV